MKYLSLSEIDPEKIEYDRLRRHITFSLLIPARGQDAARCLGDIIDANVREWMTKRCVIDEIGVLIDADSDGDLHDMIAIAREAGATWAITGEQATQATGTTKAGGKAAAMRMLAHSALGSSLIFHDADLLDYDPMTVGALAATTAGFDEMKFVNGAPIRRTGPGHPGGRTTEMLRSLISKQLHRHVPNLTSMSQLLIGEFAIDAQLFSSLQFGSGYAVEATLKALALDALPSNSVAQVELPVKHQNGQDYLDLVKQFHEISVAVDVLERYFQMRDDNDYITPYEIAARYDEHFPDRELALVRPTGYDTAHFVPRTDFYPALDTEPTYLERLEEIAILRQHAHRNLSARQKPESIPMLKRLLRRR